MDSGNRIKRSKRVAVLGAGPAGLAAAWRLAGKGVEVSVFEEKDVVGGLGAGLCMNGNIYEYGPHIFHTTDPEIFGDVKRAAGGDMFSIKKPILIKFMGEYFKYPLAVGDIISKLPKATIIKAFLSFAYHKTKAALIKHKSETSETVLVGSYGMLLYRLFFKNYIEHVWGIPPAEFSPKFARQRIPSFSALSVFYKLISVFHKAVHKKVSTADYVENVEGEAYSTKKGFSLIAEKIADEITGLGGTINLGRRVSRIKACDDGKFLVGAGPDGKEAEFDGVVSTIPISVAAGLIEPSLPAEAVSASRRLSFRSIVFVGFLIGKKQALPASILYFRELSFNRATDLSYFGFDIKPDGSTILIAEVTCGKADRFWNDSEYAKDTVTAELLSEKFFDADMIKETYVYRAEYGYPIYRLGFDRDLESVAKALGAVRGFRTAGRQGLFQYSNIHVAMKMGYEAADAIFSELCAPAGKRAVIKKEDSEEIVLRAIGNSDLENLRVWKNKNRDAFFYRDIITPAKQLEWYAGYSKDPDNYMFIAEHMSRPIGCIGFKKIGREADVYNVIVGDNRYKKKGLMSIALKMLTDYISREHSKDITVRVLKANSPAVNFYTKNGFRKVEDRGDHIFMRLDRKEQG